MKPKSYLYHYLFKVLNTNTGKFRLTWLLPFDLNFRKVQSDIQHTGISEFILDGDLYEVSLALRDTDDEYSYPYVFRDLKRGALKTWFNV